MPHVCKGNSSYQAFSLGMVNSVITCPQIFNFIIRKTPRIPEHILTCPSVVLRPFSHNLDTKLSNKRPEFEGPDWVLLSRLLSLTPNRNKNKSDKKKTNELIHSVIKLGEQLTWPSQTQTSLQEVTQKVYIENQFSLAVSRSLRKPYIEILVLWFH